jgi:hypothetical protein
MSPGHRLRTVSELTERHFGRMVRVRIADAEVDGRLCGSIALGDTVRLVLEVGGVRLFTPAYKADEAVEVWKETP